VPNDIKLDCSGSDVQVTVNGVTATFPLASVTRIDINAGDRGSQINVACTPPDTPVTVNGGRGNDIVTVGRRVSDAGSIVNGIQGSLTVNGFAQTTEGLGDQLLILDTASGTRKSFTVTDSSVVVKGVGSQFDVSTIEYTGIEVLEVKAGDAGDPGNVITVESTLPKTAVAVHAGNGADKIIVGKALSSVAGEYTLDGVRGPVTVDGQGQPQGRADKLFIEDSWGTGGTYSLTDGTFQRAEGSINIKYLNIESLEVDTSPVMDTVTVLGAPAGTLVWLTTWGGNDQVNVHVMPGSAYNLTVNGTSHVGAPGAVLMVTDVIGGAVIHNYAATPGAGSVEVEYLNGPPSHIGYQGIEAVTQVPDADRSFVQALFHTVLNRNASPGELDLWAAVVKGPGGRKAAADGIERSTEALTARVTGWYQKYFKVKPTSAELADAVAFLQKHTEEETLRQIFTAKVQVAPGPNLKQQQEQFIELVYHQLLGRAPTLQELDSGEKLLSGNKAGDLVFQILTSQEYRAATVASYFMPRLHRLPKLGEVEQWLASGLDLRGIRVGLESSQEFYDYGY
jgi:hypothetical protein